MNPIPTQIYTIPTPNPIPLHMIPNPESNPDSDSDSSFDSDSGFGMAPGLRYTILNNADSNTHQAVIYICVYKALSVRWCVVTRSWSFLIRSLAEMPASAVWRLKPCSRACRAYNCTCVRVCISFKNC